MSNLLSLMIASRAKSDQYLKMLVRRVNAEIPISFLANTPHNFQAITIILFRRITAFIAEPICYLIAIFIKQNIFHANEKSEDYNAIGIQSAGLTNKSSTKIVATPEEL